MSTQFWLTDEVADIPTYLRAKLGARSDAYSLVEAATKLVASGAHIQATRIASGTPVYGPTTLAWVTDQLTGFATTQAAWTAHVWAKVDAAADNAGLRFQVLRFTNAEGALLFDSSVGVALTTTMTDAAFATAADNSVTLSSGDRLVFKVWFDNVGTMGAGTGTLAYNGVLSGAEGDTYFTAPENITAYAALPASDITNVRNLIQDNGSTQILTDAQITQSFNDALKVYSQDRPRSVVDYYSGDNATYQYPLPRSWVHGFSEILEIEYPTGSQQPQMLQDTDYRIRTDGVNGIPQTAIWHLQYIPATGVNNLKLKYAVPQVHTTLVDTIDPQDVQALTWLAASHAAVMLANHYAFLAESTVVQADVANYRDLTARWTANAKVWAQMYDDHVRGEVPTARATGMRDNWNTNLSFGLDRLFHRRRWR